MDRGRRVVVSVVCVALLVGVALGAGRFLALAAPFTGDAWTAAPGANDGSVGTRLDRAVTGPRVVESPYGEATVRIDDRGVPHVTAENERAVGSRPRSGSAPSSRTGSTAGWGSTTPRRPPGARSGARRPATRSPPTPPG